MNHIFIKWFQKKWQTWSRKETYVTVFSILVMFQRWAHHSLLLHQVIFRVRTQAKIEKNQFHTVLDFINTWYYKCANNLVFSTVSCFKTYIFPFMQHLFIWSILVPHKGKLRLWSFCLVLRASPMPAYVVTELFDEDQDYRPGLPVASDCSSTVMALRRQVSSSW